MSDIRVLGKRLGQCVGQEAIVLGKISGKSSDGMSMELITTDNIRINVTLPDKLDKNISDYIEVRGDVKSKSTMSCNSFVCFPSSMTTDFDENGYNTMLHTRYAIANRLEGAFYKS